ncbi:MAG: 2-C-methyl-D-erythritol 2,4-cyclodiphosphate synthase, partial [Victivallales bacterium]|nr:2-C-methyl-D-erythritol 2,4-cyclodiphosphate synthase [Victivallales bacterium]
ERFAVWRLGNIDCVVIAQKPKICSFIPAMRANFAAAFSTELDHVSIKATTTERLGFCGREEGIAAMATLILESHQSG